ncbi:MAG: endopeptidase La [Lachnospiraceae bacterium]|nr:endopeptidase La [Lachnospiraceae bacterium]
MAEKKTKQVKKTAEDREIKKTTATRKATVTKKATSARKTTVASKPATAKKPAAAKATTAKGKASASRREQFPAVVLRSMVVFPGMVLHFDITHASSIRSVQKAMETDRLVFVVAQKESAEKNPDVAELYNVGTIAKVQQMAKLPGNTMRVLVEGQSRAFLYSFDKGTPDHLIGNVEQIPEGKVQDPVREQAMLQEIKSRYLDYVQNFPKTRPYLTEKVQADTEIGRVLDMIASGLAFPYTQKQEILSALDIADRFERLAIMLTNEVDIAQVKNELSQQIKSRLEKNQKEYILREQLQYIQEELGGDELSDAERFEKQLAELQAPDEVKDKIQREINRFRSISSNSSESAVERGYIETLLELPWNKASEDNTDIVHAKEILETQHYGLQKVKERILEFLAVRALTKKGDSPIICLVGPPGTGKTSIARSVAEALGKEYVRISLGGVRDEAEIRGHRRTYVGAMPGRIAVGLKQAKVKNPLMLLDEIDKVSSDYKGDTSSALLEVLDSEQNCRFSDHYVEIPLDLSEVLFIATANTTQTIPKPLLDRMEVIEVTSYTSNEKFHIAKEYLLEKQLKKNGLEGGRLSINDSALKDVIEFYTREAGVRELERKIGEICRKAAREILEKDPEKTRVKVNSRNLEQYLGKQKYRKDKKNDKDEIGIVRGLAWTSVGGVTLQIEVNSMPGKGKLELTGQMGDVMKESAMTALSFVRSVSPAYKVPADYYETHDFHLHIPEGAVPKDGPSAGITMATALLSVAASRKVRADIAMTGEITLRGRVLPIGGLKEKILAAKIAGIKTVLIPKQNVKDAEEIEEEIKEGLTIIPVETMKDVLKEAFV